MSISWKSVLFAATTLSLIPIAPAFQVDNSLLSGMTWRNIGPFRGGRVAAVSGVIGQPGTYYMGLPAGGVWKTTSAGTTWYPIFDGIKDASSVGAVEVAPSDPNVIYVGMGDMRTGGCINDGNGLYKSTDAGKTWTHMGLNESKQIPSILVDPRNPDLVLIAAQGEVREETTDRGLYRSTDGGKSWTKTLYVDKQTGIQKLAWAFDHPDTILATTVRHYSPPGAPRGGGGQAGADSGTKLFISHDEGLTWTRIIGHGLPSLAGRTCVAVANGTDAKRMYIVGNFGLYRSDDGGDSWRQMDAADKRVANGQGGYNCGVYVNPKNPDIVYVINTCSYRSLDGGKTFTGFKGAPGGDDPQQMWLDPTDGNRLFFGTDQGATVSLDGGQSWSNWYNQPTAQVYKISVDNQFPYWVYATQQDSGCVGTASRGNLGAITPMDWLPHPGYEFGSIVADPLNPKISYAGGNDGGIAKTTYPSGQWINVAPNMNPTMGLRHASNQLLAFSPTNPRELFAAYQCLMSTTDGGKHWQKLSPDLGAVKQDPPAKPATAPPTKATKPGEKLTPAPVKTGGTMVEMDEDEDIDPDDFDALVEQQFAAGGAIESFSPSSVDGNIIWVGTTNGMIKVTKNHGQTWEDVSIPLLRNARRADISTIDSSHHSTGTAYVAIDYHNTGDYKPYFYRTHDFGRTWKKIVNGLPTDLASGSFARVIRADTVKEGLLFAGTESSLYVSFDDGDNWQSIAQNAPNTSYRDMVIKGNDVVVGTYGRSFWILDDISPLREMKPEHLQEPAHLYKPGTAIRVRRNVNGDTPFPPEVPHALNPPSGALIYYTLGKAAQGTVAIEISAKDGKVIRHLTSEPAPPLNEPEPPIPNFWIGALQPLPTGQGMHRINWNLRYDSPRAFSHEYQINANPGETPLSPEGPLALPGEYKVTLKIDGKSYSQMVTVENDPRSPASMGDLRSQFKLQSTAYMGAKRSFELFDEMAPLKAKTTALLDTKLDAKLSKAVEDFDTKLSALRGAAGGRGRGGFGGPRPAPSASRLVGSFIGFMTTLDSGDMAPNQTMIETLKAQATDLASVEAGWKQLVTKELAELNKLLEAAKIPALTR